MSDVATPNSVTSDVPTHSARRRLDARTIVRMIIGIALAVAALVAPFLYSPDINHLLAQALYLAIAAMGLNLLTGFNGQVSLGHGAFFGIGAFTTAILMVDHGWSFEATIPVAATYGCCGRRARRDSGSARPRPVSRAAHARPGRDLPSGGDEVRDRQRRRGSAAPRHRRVQLADQRARQRSVAVLRVPGLRRCPVRAGLEPDPQPGRPVDDRRTRSGAGRGSSRGATSPR